MSNILDELTTADPKDKVFTDEQMGTLGAMVNELLLVQSNIIEQEDRLKNMKAAERKINQVEIPQLMDSLGFESITVDGRKVAVKDNVQISIPAALKPEAYSWMDKNGHGDLIKIALSAKFQRGEKDMADEAFNALLDVGASPTQSEAVHPGTLKAWARVELEQGHSLPQQFFKVHVVKLTTVK
jgi:hypothetical protein